MKSNGKRAQGSLEFLIILAAVIAMAAIVVIITLNSAGGSKEEALLLSCQQAAANCEINLGADSNYDCTDLCTVGCTDAGGTPVVQNAVACCKAGNKNAIYDGSTVAC
ncbi:MAG: class III signal peptide-containing protein [Candidatus Micrarchaeota archaeon]